MSKFKKDNKKGGIRDVIYCEDENYLISKWHPSGYEEGLLKREDSIRSNSVLKVRTGEVAVFVCKQDSKTFEDYVEGPFEEKLKTANLPILSKIVSWFYEGDTPFQAQVFFINVGKSNQIKFGIPYFNVSDPRYRDFEVPVAVRGTLLFKIEDYREFVKYHKLESFNFDEFQEKVLDTICTVVKDVVSKEPIETNTPVISIESRINDIAMKAEYKLRGRINDVFSIKVTGLEINSIDIDKSSEEYQELKSITKDIVKREREASILDVEERLRINREEDQYAKHMHSSEVNIRAFQTEKAGSNGTEKPSDNNDGANQIPPIPQKQYYYAENGKPVGPNSLEKLISLVTSGVISGDTMVWRTGDPNWVEANSLEELRNYIPPKIF